MRGYWWALFRPGMEQGIFCISDMLTFFFPRFQIRCGVAEKEILFVSRSAFSVIGGVLSRDNCQCQPCQPTLVPPFIPVGIFLGSLPPSQPASSGPCCPVMCMIVSLPQIPASSDSALVFLLTRLPCEVSLKEIFANDVLSAPFLS